MHTVFLNLKKLYEYELYANVLPIGSIILTAYSHDRSVLTADQHFLTLVYYANSLYYERLYRRAEEYYRLALQAKKSTNKLNQSTTGCSGGGGGGQNYSNTGAGTIDQFSEIEIRYKTALCLEAIRQISEAVTVLQVIPVKQRSPKINMLLAKLIQNNGYDKNAIAPLKAALKECPLNLDAIKGLLSMGVKISEINLIISDSELSVQSLDWLSNYTLGYSHMYACKFQLAIDAFQAIESKPDIGDNDMFLVLLGQCHHFMGNYDAALRYLERAYHNKLLLTEGLMTLAALFAIKNRMYDLEKLTMPIYTTGEYTAEHWFVLAQFLFCQEKYDKAAYFAQKSCHLKPKNAEATLLKVKIFMQMKKYTDAIVSLRTTEQFANYRFEVYELLVDAYIALHRIREALEISKTINRRLNPLVSARSLILLAKPYFCHDDPLQKVRAKQVCVQALTRDEYYLPAVYMLVEILQEEGDIAGAKKIIKKQLTVKPNSKLHSMLGDLQSKEKDLTKAVENYTIAINMDPTNRKAVAGLIAMGHSLTTKRDHDTYSAPSSSEEANDYQENTFEMVEIPQTPGEAESESEALWSDVELDANP